MSGNGNSIFGAPVSRTTPVKKSSTEGSIFSSSSNLGAASVAPQKVQQKTAPKPAVEQGVAARGVLKQEGAATGAAQQKVAVVPGLVTAKAKTPKAAVPQATAAQTATQQAATAKKVTPKAATTVKLAPKLEAKKAATIKPLPDLFDVSELEDDFSQELERVVEEVEKKHESRAQKALKTVERRAVRETDDDKDETPAELEKNVKKPGNSDEKNGKKAATKKSGESEKTAEGDEKTGGSKKPEEGAKGSSKKTGKSGKKPKKEKKKRTFKQRMALAVAGVIVIVLAGGALWGHNLIARVTGGNSGIFDAVGALMNASTPFKTDDNGRTNILAFGTSGYDMGGSGHDGAQLTDSIMLISLNQDSGDVAMVSLPRDLYVGNTCTSVGKINEVFWCANPDNNDEKTGATTLVTQVEKILDVDIQYWAHMNWGALVRLVDLLGGIDVTLDEPIEDDWTGTFIQARVETHLDGERALGLARARHGTISGDFTRGNSQQKILMALFEKMKSRGLNFVSAMGLINTLGDNLRTNFAIGEMKTGFDFAAKLNGEKLRQVSLMEEGNEFFKTDIISGISYEVPSEGLGKYGQIHAYMRKQLSNFSSEGAVISVINASGKAGASMNERTKLEKAGLLVGGTSSVTGDYPEKYYLYAVNYDKTETKTALEKMYGAASRPADELPENVKIDGYDFIVLLGRGQ